MIARVLVGAALLATLASCPRTAPTVRATATPDLETAAILRGLVRDPADRDIVGLYARDTDRLCIVRAGRGHRVGVTVDYGDGTGCSGAGTVSRAGETLRLDLGRDCKIAARFDGDRIVFPVPVPDACTALCVRRATLAAIDVERLSESAAEAATMRDANGRTPCATS